MKISALIAANKSGATLTNALASVRIQTTAACELLIVDYGPPDETEEIVKGYAVSAPVHYERLPEGTSPAARNRLIELATGDAVAFLEPADAWTARHLQNAEQHLANADLAVSDIRLFDRRNGRPLNEVAPPPQLATNPTRALFTRETILSPSSVVFRRELARRAGGFDPHFRVGAARDFWFRCALGAARFELTQRATCQCPKGGDGDPNRALLAAEHTVLFYEKYRDLAVVPAALRRRLLAASLVAHGRLLRNTDHARAARCFWRAWSLQPVQVQTLGEFALTEWQPGSSSPFASEPANPPGTTGDDPTKKPR